MGNLEELKDKLERYTFSSPEQFDSGEVDTILDHLVKESPEPELSDFDKEESLKNFKKKYYYKNYRLLANVAALLVLSFLVAFTVGNNVRARQHQSGLMEIEETEHGIQFMVDGSMSIPSEYPAYYYSWEDVPEEFLNKLTIPGYVPKDLLFFRIILHDSFTLKAEYLSEQGTKGFSITYDLNNRTFQLNDGGSLSKEDFEKICQSIK